MCNCKNSTPNDEALPQQDLTNRLRITKKIATLAEKEAARIGISPQEWLEYQTGVGELSGKFKIRAEQSPLQLPELGTMPTLDERKDKSQNPVEFYNEHWKKYADAGILYQFILTQHDPKIVNRIRSHCRRYKIDPVKILPPPKSVKITRESKRIGLEPEDLRKLASTLSSRRYRASFSNDM